LAVVAIVSGIDVLETDVCIVGGGHAGPVAARCLAREGVGVAVLEDWSRGCYASHYGPRVLSSYGSTLRQPFGLVYWAGSKTSPVWSSNIEGAICSGERAAAEVLDRP